MEGLRLHAPGIVDPLVEYADELWAAVEQLPLVGRTFFGAHLAVPRPADPLLSGWHAVNCLREWRGDTHWALVVAAGLGHAEASVLHNGWLGYEPDWLARSRGTATDDIEAAWASLASVAWPTAAPSPPPGWRCGKRSRMTPTASPRCRGS